MADKPETSLPGMVEKMTKATSPTPTAGFTLGWDVVVSYSEKEINQHLRAKWEKNPSELLGEIVTDITDRTPWGGKTRVKYRVKKLGAPLIQFPTKVFRDPIFEMHFPVLAGSTQQVDVETGEKALGEEVPLLENAYTIRLKGIRIGTVVGKYDEVKRKTERNGSTLNVQSSQNTCFFRDESRINPEKDFEVAWVVLDFPVEPDDLQVAVDLKLGDDVPKDTREMAESMRPYLQRAMEVFFLEGKGKDRVDIIKYALATVKNKELPKKDIKVNLTPKSFRMAVFSADYDERGILSLFIHTVGGKDSGETRNLQALWLGQWTNNKTTPIPDSHTASLIFHPELIFDQVVAPSLMKDVDNDWKLTRLSDDNGGGIRFQAARQKPFKTDGFRVPYAKDKTWFDKIFGPLQSNVKRELDISAWNQDLSGRPATIYLTQTDADKLPVATIKWEIVFESTWKIVHTSKELFTGTEREDYFNETKLRSTYKLNHDCPMKITATDADLTFDIDTNNIESHWALTEKEVPIETNSAGEKLSRWLDKALNSGPPEKIMKQRTEKLSELRPRLDFGILGLGFFLSTNLLNPGAQVIEIDQDVGMRLPGNLVLVGSVVTGVDSEKKSN